MMNATIDLDDDTLAEAARNFFASEWAAAREEAGFSFAAGTEITEVCPDQDTDKLLELIRPYVADLARAWGRGVGEMFRLMEIPEDEWADALYYVLMGCRGHGVGLEDDYDENIEIAGPSWASRSTRPPSIPSSRGSPTWPTRSSRPRPSRPTPTPIPTTRSGPAIGSGWTPGCRAGTRSGAPGPSSAAPVIDDGVIVTMDDGEGVEPWSYSGRTVSVGADECESIG